MPKRSKNRTKISDLITLLIEHGGMDGYVVICDHTHTPRTVSVTSRLARRGGKADKPLYEVELSATSTRARRG